MTSATEPRTWPDSPIDFGRPLSLDRQLGRAVALAPDRTAVVTERERLSFAELDGRANRAAGALERLGVAPGQRVAVCLPNGIDIVSVLFGCWKIGAIFTGVHRVLAAPEKAYLLDDCGAELLIADRANTDQVGGRLAERTTLRRLVEVDPDTGASEWHTLLDAADDAAPERTVDPLSCAAIAYTSGTTGRPKGVMHSQHNALLVGACAVELGHRDHDVTDLAVHAMTILNLMILHPLTTIQGLAKLVITDRHDPQSLARWIREEEVVHISVVPTVMHELLTSDAVADADLKSVRKPRTGGAAMSEEAKARFMDRFGFKPATSFSLTEGPAQVARQDAGEPTAEGSCGRPLPHIAVEIQDVAGRPCPVGEVGEICFGPMRDGRWAGVYRTMLGYWGRPGDSSEALRGGLMHSGDMGRLDADGQLFIVDRKSQLIIRGGSNIYPAEIERVLLSVESVVECVVVPKPDDKYGELVVAFVQTRAGSAPTEGELLDLCRAELASYKVPYEIRFVDEFPRTPLGKIRRSDVKA